MHGEHKDGDVDVLSLEVLDQFQAAGAAQGDVHDGNIGLLLADERHGIFDVVGFAADFHAEVTIDQVPDVLAKHRVIFHQGHLVAFAGAGIILGHKTWVLEGRVSL